MDRIAILGCGGSGKTHLANQLAALLDIPVTHLDGLYYDSGWTPSPSDEFAARQHELVRAPRFLIEGNYAATLPIRLAAADTVIFLDVHALTCLLGVRQRRRRYRGGQHAEAGVYDRVTWGFVRYVWGYRTSMRPRVRQLLGEHARHARLITLTSRRQATRFLDRLRAERRPQLVVCTARYRGRCACGASAAQRWRRACQALLRPTVDHRPPTPANRPRGRGRGDACRRARRVPSPR